MNDIALAIEIDITSVIEKNLFLDFRAGDFQAFAVVMRRQQNFATVTVSTFTRDKKKVADIVLRAFIRLWNNREEIPDASYIRDYLSANIKELIQEK